MRLYATTTSERASKGQGGKYLEIEITDEKKRILAIVNVDSECIRFRPNPYTMEHGEVSEVRVKGKCAVCGKLHGRTDGANICESCSADIPH